MDRQQRAVSVQVSVRGACLSLRAHLPEAYPAREPPLVEVDGPNATQTITNFALKAIQDHFVPGLLQGLPLCSCAQCIMGL